MKLGLEAKDEPDIKSEDIEDSNTEIGFRAHLRNFKVAHQALQNQTRRLMGGKRKREEDD